MTYKFSAKSLNNLEGVHPLLVDVVQMCMAQQIMDFSVHEGVRSLDRQKSLVARGVSKTMRSKHLIQSSGFGHAVDLYPSPVSMVRVNAGDAREIARFGVLNGIMQVCAKKMGVIVLNGMDWDGDGETLDHTFFDAPHYELVLK